MTESKISIHAAITISVFTWHNMSYITPNFLLVFGFDSIGEIHSFRLFNHTINFISEFAKIIPKMRGILRAGTLFELIDSPHDGCVSNG